jgi:hypothetical protein
MALTEIEPYHWVGDDSALMLLRPVGDVLRVLSKINISLLSFDITVTDVYMRPRPYGFDFRCKKVSELLTLVKGMSVKQLAKSATDFETDKTNPVFNEDRGDSVEGTISAGVTKGHGFRQIGTGAVLHFEIQENGSCNVHIDSHGYVMGMRQYDWGRNGLLHGYWDLLSDKLPGLFGSFGDSGQVGPMIRPIRDLDGRMRWYIGLTGQW